MTSAFKVFRVSEAKNAYGIDYTLYQITVRGSMLVCRGNGVYAIRPGNLTPDLNPAVEDHTLATVCAEYQEQSGAWHPRDPEINYSEKDQTLTFLSPPVVGKG